MSTTTPATPTSRAHQPTLDVSGTAPIPFSRLVAVELRKAVDTRAGLWLMIVTGLLTLIVMGIVLAVTVAQDFSMDLGAFVGTTTYSSALLLPVIGILLITGEWGQRTAVSTFSLEPRRPLVLGAKYVAGLALALLVAVVAFVLAVVANAIYGAASGSGAEWGIDSSFVIGFVLTQVFAMSIGYALATLFLNTPIAIVVYFVYSWVLPAVFAIGAALMSWFESLRPWIDFNYAQTPLFDGSFDWTGDDLGHLVVSGIVWLVVPVVLGTARVLRAEVK